jgi:hypothetical protein
VVKRWATEGCVSLILTPQCAPCLRPEDLDAVSEIVRKEPDRKHGAVIQASLEILGKRFALDDKTEGYRKDGPILVAEFKLGEGDKAEQREARALRQRQASDVDRSAPGPNRIGDSVAIKAICVGINKYLDAIIPELNGARNDAMALCALFTDAIEGLAARLLVDEGATHSEVSQAILGSLSAPYEDDAVIITF